MSLMLHTNFYLIAFLGKEKIFKWLYHSNQLSFSRTRRAPMKFNKIGAAASEMSFEKLQMPGNRHWTKLDDNRWSQAFNSKELKNYHQHTLICLYHCFTTTLSGHERMTVSTISAIKIQFSNILINPTVAGSLRNCHIWVISLFLPIYSIKRHSIHMSMCMAFIQLITDLFVNIINSHFSFTLSDNSSSVII